MNTRIETGRLETPYGTSYIGFKVTIGEILDPSVIQRTYDDIEAILKSNKTPYRVHEERTERGTFKSYSVETN